MQNEEKRPANWWQQQGSYTGFFIREISGIVIAIFSINYIALLFFAVQKMEVPSIITTMNYPLAILGFIAALIHTFTWLPVMPKIAPFPLNKAGTIIAIINLLIIWLAVSYALLQIL